MDDKLNNQCESWMINLTVNVRDQKYRNHNGLRKQKNSGESNVAYF